MKRLNQTGAGHIVAILLVLVVGVVGFAGYKVYDAQQSKSTSNSVADSSSSTTPTELKQADQTLTQADSELSSSLDTTALDADIDALL